MWHWSDFKAPTVVKHKTSAQQRKLAVSKTFVRGAKYQSDTVRQVSAYWQHDLHCKKIPNFSSSGSKKSYYLLDFVNGQHKLKALIGVFISLGYLRDDAIGYYISYLLWKILNKHINYMTWNCIYFRSLLSLIWIMEQFLSLFVTHFILQ